jgi:pyrimidine operon attenuation protein/uracil phosphoribosyltransferase
MRAKDKAILRKIKALESKVIRKQRTKRNPVLAGAAAAGAILAGAEVVDKILDTAIWVVDNYYNVPPEK